jgi:drug/metabolite transporter (DMT)-like permease
MRTVMNIREDTRMISTPNRRGNEKATDPESPITPAPQPVALRTAALALLTVALWGANPVAVSYSVDTLPPIAVATIRFALATVFMFFWCHFEGSDLRLRANQRLPVFLAALGLFLQIGIFNIGVELSNSSHASMMINTFVFWVVVIEHFITKGDRLTGRKLIGLLVACGGVLLLLMRTEDSAAPRTEALDTPTLIGDVLLLLSAFLLGIKIVYVKHALKVIEPGKLIFWHDALGVLMFCGYSFLLEEIDFSGLTRAAVLGLLYQGVFVGGLCFALQAVLLRHHSASQIAVFSFATPLFGVGLGVLMRGDHITPWLFVAAVCVAVGILLVNARPRDEPTDSG